MVHKLLVVGAGTVALTAAAFAQVSEYGTADEARALLERAVAAVKADKAKALETFNREDGGFRDRDLYVFCVHATDGVETAHPTHRGEKIGDLKDANGFAFGQEILKKASAGTISEVVYLWPRPGSDTPLKKVTYVTKIDDQICGVGYYK